MKQLDLFENMEPTPVESPEKAVQDRLESIYAFFGFSKADAIERSRLAQDVAPPREVDKTRLYTAGRSMPVDIG